MKAEVVVSNVADGILLVMRGSLGKEGGESVLRSVQEQEVLPRRLVLDFSGVTLINTAGIGGILWAIRLVSKAGGRAVAFGLNDHLRKIFHVMGLTQYLTVATGKEEAMGGPPQ